MPLGRDDGTGVATAFFLVEPGHPLLHSEFFLNEFNNIISIGSIVKVNR